MSLSIYSRRGPFLTLWLFAACGALFLTAASASAGVWYVNAAAPAGGGGTTWATAFQDLQSAVDAASNAGGGEVWAAGGTYVSTAPVVLEMAAGVDLYGGFTGVETARDQRDWTAHPAIIDGGNARRCVVAADIATLNGFVIGNGKAYGMIIDDCSPVVANCVFLHNGAGGGSGAIRMDSSDAAISDCVFIGNEAAEGGAIQCWCSSPRITRCCFRNNTAKRDGGAVFIWGCYSAQASSTMIENCVFSGNKARYGGGVSIYRDTVKMNNCTFTANSSIAGGAVCAEETSAATSITNSILWANTSVCYSEINLAEGSSISVAFSDVQGGYAGEGNIEADPQFVGNGPWASVQLRPGSPCVDAGTAGEVSAADILNRPRQQGAGVDMGAYEGPVAPADVVTLTVASAKDAAEGHFPPSGEYLYARDESVWLFADGSGPCAFLGWEGLEDPLSRIVIESDETVTAQFDSRIFRVDAAGTAYVPDGATWETAFRDLQMAVDYASTQAPCELWVAGGCYTSTANVVLVMKPGVYLYGGFGGTETERDQRNWNAHPATIDGENARQCVEGADNSTLDGFVITRGDYADGYGAGMRNDHVSPSIRNCVFTANLFDHAPGGSSANLVGGAAIGNDSSSPKITNCVFTDNTAFSSGAILNMNDSNAEISDCLFARNRSYGYGEYIGGGAISNQSGSDSAVTRCAFFENEAGEGGAVFAYEASSAISNCVFRGNRSSIGAAVALQYCEYIAVSNCTFVGNIADYYSALIANKDGYLCTHKEIVNCVFWENRNTGSSLFVPNDFLSTNANVTYSCVQGGYPGEGNIDADPQFVGQGLYDSLQLREDSPCIDAGTSVGAPNSDFMNRARPQGAAFDMGAYEGGVSESDIVTLTVTESPEGPNGTIPPPGVSYFGRGETVWLYGFDANAAFFDHWEGVEPGAASVLMTDDRTVTAVFNENIYYVDIKSAAAHPDGRSWATAFRDIQSAVDAVTQDGRGEIWVAKGTYTSTEESVVLISRSYYDMSSPLTVHLYGGFSGGEISRDQRDWQANQTILDGENTRSCVFIYACEDNVVDGFVVTHGKSADYAGGIVDQGYRTRIAHCIFAGNAGNYGGALCCSSNGSAIKNCTFLNNSAEYAGGACYLPYGEDLEVTNCVFLHNTAQGGGALFLRGLNIRITSCTFLGNIAETGGAISSADFYAGEPLSLPMVTNCILWGDTAETSPEIFGYEEDPIVTYSCIQGGFSGEGNIDADPLFTGQGLNTSLQLRTGSPCLDSGTTVGAPAMDIRGIPRPQGGGVDMGAYEGFFNANQLLTLTIQISPEGAGTVSPAVSSSCFAPGDTVWLSARGTGMMTFDHWEGDIQSDERELFIIMNTGLHVTAVFREAIIYVDADSAAAAPDGSSWEQAYPDFRSVTYDDEAEIWVAEGVYASTGDAVLTMRANSRYYGGFAGTETARDQRDWNAHPAIMDGENSRRCVVGADNTVLDGFLVRNGEVQTDDEYDGDGGGIFMSGGDMRILNCSFVGNEADCGGGIYFYSGNIDIEHCVLTGNRAWRGGAVSVVCASGRISECSYIRNTGDLSDGWGGGIFSFYSTMEIINCRFADNQAASGGAILIIEEKPVTVVNSIFTRNAAGYGGSICSQNASYSIVHCAFVDDNAQHGSDIYSERFNNESRGSIRNCILWHTPAAEIDPILDTSSTLTVTSSCIQGGYPGEGNIDAYPRFVDSVDDGNGWNLRLMSTSPCINAGSSAGLPGSAALDIAGTPRPQGAGYDMGAYEFTIGHSADQNGDNRIDLSELLRVVQMFNMDGYRCADAGNPTEDGYFPGAGDEHGCAPHSSDYVPQDWKINLSELLRLIQIYNMGGYRKCPDAGTEDGFCPGAV